MKLPEKYKGATPGLWSVQKLYGWGNIPVITADTWPKPIAQLHDHPDVYYTHERTEHSDGSGTTRFRDRTPEGEARKSEVIAERDANARLIADAPMLACRVAELEQALQKARSIVRQHNLNSTATDEQRKETIERFVDWWNECAVRGLLEITTGPSSTACAAPESHEARAAHEEQAA